MDTRTKIVALDELRRRVNGRAIRFVRGNFDPLLAEHARRLERMHTPGACLAVVIQNSTESLLPVMARAELVAALSTVDFVVLDAGSVPAALPAEDLNDMPITEHFSEHVRRRHRQEGA